MRMSALVVAAALFTACSVPVEGHLTVGVASSLVEVLRAVDAGRPGPPLTYSVAGSQVLVAQVRDGAPLDVVITADERTARALERQGALAGPPVRFAGNRMAIAVRTGNPAGIAGLGDLVDPSLTLVLAAPEVPAGAYARQVLTAAGVEALPDSLEPSARAVLAKVALGEADAGIVYETDLTTGNVDGVRIDPAYNVDTSYYAAVVAGSAHAQAAVALVEYLRSEAAAAVLAGYGFLP